MTDQEIQDLAHRVCYHYDHSNDPDFRKYTFGKLTLIDFVRAVEVRLNAEWMAKCEELRRDAERYRWLRQDGFVPNDFEKVVDAALAKKEGA